MRGGNKPYTNWVNVYLHLMLVVEVIRNSQSVDDTWCYILWCLTDLLIGTNILKVERQSGIWQPEALGSHTCPGLGGKTLDILLHYSTFQFFLPKVLIEMQDTNCFIVIPALLVCTSPLAYLQVNLTPGRRLFQANIAGSCLWRAGWQAAGPGQLNSLSFAGPARHA